MIGERDKETERAKCVWKFAGEGGCVSMEGRFVDKKRGSEEDRGES